MEEKINFIKAQLGTGSINLFGMPFSGKDTVGVRLAQDLGGRFLSSGLILRTAAENDKELEHCMAVGQLAPSARFEEIVLGYFGRPDLAQFPLILSSVGRWEGEEFSVMRAAEAANHPVRAAILLNASESEIRNRWEVAQTLQDRGKREDDKIRSILAKRIEEFKTKTMPVIATYQKRGLLVPVNGHAEKDVVYASTIDALYEYFRNHPSA